jgi:hypothetical protein
MQGIKDLKDQNTLRTVTKEIPRRSDTASATKPIKPTVKMTNKEKIE